MKFFDYCELLPASLIFKHLIPTVNMITLALVVVLLITLYLYGIRNYKYWLDRGIKFNKPLPFLGNNLKATLFKASITQVADELYWSYPNERVVGFYSFSRPVLLIRDPEIVKRILTTDFTYFHSRGVASHKDGEVESLMKNLFSADGDLWKLLRQRMTPAFTSGKLKAMFPLLVERAERLKSRVQTLAAEGKSIDARELMARYTTDLIGACGFGLDSDSLNDEDSAVRRFGKSIFKVRVQELVMAIAIELFPKTFKKWTKSFHLENNIKEIVEGIIKKRNYKPSRRGDFLDLMLECREKGVIVGNSMVKKAPDGSPEIVSLEFNDGLIAAQVFVYFAAGFETSSSATSYTLHQLAYNQHVQKKAQEEVDRVLTKHDGKLSYDSIREMTYLDMVFKEGSRMFPSVGVMLRKCDRTFTFPELNLTIDKEVRVVIPVQSLHNDPKYFPNPEEFKPERFDPEAYDNSNKYFYLPFGAGPRACLAERLGVMQSLAGLAAVLSSFTVEPASESVRHPVVDPMAIVVQSIKGGLPLMFRPRYKSSLKLKN